VGLPGLSLAQTAVVPPRVVGAPVVTRAIVPPRVVEPRVVAPAAVAPVAVVPATREVVRETVVAPTGVGSWWDAFGKLRYGYYDDGFADDNWFYDYYESPPAAVAVERPVSAAVGNRTSWRYDPLVEQRLFRW
jgi:hypothetical protein